MNKVAQILFQLYCDDRLAPFYIIRPPVAGQPSQFSKLLNNVYSELSQLILKYHDFRNPEHTLAIGHSDIVYIEKEDKTKNYKQADPAIQQFFSAQKHGPLELKNKFIWVDQANHITEVFLNKWLKTLEEPTASLTTLFLVHDHGPLLKTIESRAISMKLCEEQLAQRPKEVYSSFTQFLKNGLENQKLHDALEPFLNQTSQIHVAIEALKNKPELHELLLLAFQEYWSHCNASPIQLQRALEEIKWHNKSKIYNNLATERIYGLLSCLKEQL